MAKKDDRRKLAREQAEAQRNKRLREERRNKFIMIGVITTLIVVAVGVVGGIIWHNKAEAARYKAQVEKSYHTPNAQIKTNQGFVLGSQGEGKPNEGAPEVELFYDYTCNGCLELEHQNGKGLFELAASGDITLRLLPVKTHDTAFNHAATDAAIKVAEKDPSMFLAFHVALMDKGYEALMLLNDNKPSLMDGTARIEDPASAKEAAAAVEQVAKKVGIDQKLIDTFAATGADKTLEEWSKVWTDRAIKDGLSTLSTPMIRVNGKYIDVGPLQGKTLPTPQVKDILLAGEK